MSSVNEWPTVKLGEVAAFVRGVTFKPADKVGPKDGVPVMRTKNVQACLDLSDVIRIPASLVKEGRYLLAGDTLVSTANSWNLVGKCCWVPKLTEPTAIGGFVSALRTTSEELLPRYLYYWFNSSRIQTTVRSFSNQTTNISNLSVKRCLNLQIPLPPLAEQQRIAEILDVTQHQFGQIEAKKSSLASLRVGLVNQLLDANDRETLPLKQIAEIQSGITKGRKVRVGETLTEIPYMAVSNVKDGYLDLQAVKTIPVTGAEIIRFRLQAGDILLTEGGDPDKLGRGTVWREEIETCLHQNHIFRVRLPEDSQFTPEVLKAMLSTKQARAYFFRSAKQTTGIASINKTQLSAVPVPILTSTEITRLSEILTQIDALSETIDERWKATEDLQHSLSTRAFAGQL